MKIAYISDLPWYLGFGGREVQMLKYAEYLSKNHGVQVIFPNYFDKKIDDEIKLFHFFGYSNWYSGLISIIKNKRNAKIIISPTFYHEKPFFLKLAKFYSRFCFIPNYFSYKRKLFQFSDIIVANSKSESVFLQRLFDIPEKKITVVHNAVDRDFDSISREDSNSFIEAYSIDPGYILSVSAITERKNTLNLIKSFLAISNQINKKLVIIGDYQCTRVGFQKRIERLINENRDKILHVSYLPPYSSMLKSAYANCAVHYLPSFIETPGLSNLEAVLFNKPIVVGDCQPVREYFKNYVTYCNPYSITDISDKLLSALNTLANPEAADYIRNNFTWKAVVEELYKTYQKVFGE
jgi:glycosyltransferase involved in cell wall biosynthesis